MEQQRFEKYLPNKEVTVSVIIPAFNCEDYIEESICSVLNQSFSDFELIIVDDASTDHTLEILRDYQDKDPRIKVISQKKNAGVANTRNKGFDHCRGKFIALLDADDYWQKDKLKKQIEAQAETNADLIYCSYEIVNEKGAKICDDFLVPATTSLNETLKQNVINCSTALFKSEIIQKHRFSSEYYHEDLVFWIDLLKEGIKVFGLKEVLASYRRVSGSRASDKLKSAKNRYIVLRDYLGLPFYKDAEIMLVYAFKAANKYRRK